MQPLGNVWDRYQRYMDGCYTYWEEKVGQGIECNKTEYDRIVGNLNQPPSVRNYTTLGYKKIRAPDKVFQLLQDFWQQNKDFRQEEAWQVGEVFANHWEAPSYVVPVQNEDLPGGGEELQQHIWDAARDTIAEWTGHELVETSLYGIRIYTKGATLSPHVDDFPLVASCIINVDQDVDEPWPLEVIGHDGIARNVTMEPGDMVLYESHSVIHGRQFPLKGRFFANVFIHFEPLGPLHGGGSSDAEINGDLPPFLIPGSPSEAEWRAENPNGHIIKGQPANMYVKGGEEALALAANGELEELEEWLDEYPDAVNARDINGWTPLAEAIRNGREDVVQVLLNRGADVHVLLGPNQEFESMLYLAQEAHGADHAIARMLRERGAIAIGKLEEDEEFTTDEEF